MDVTEIVKTWLTENGYDGLVDQDCECGCQVSDLIPCGEGFEKCEAGHKKEADPESGWDFLMYPGKAQPEDSADKKYTRFHEAEEFSGNNFCPQCGKKLNG